MRGVSPIHHEYSIIAKRDDGNYVVRNPELFLLESEGERPASRP
jgi:hypothetical protein